MSAMDLKDDISEEELMRMMEELENELESEARAAAPKEPEPKPEPKPVVAAVESSTVAEEEEVKTAVNVEVETTVAPVAVKTETVEEEKSKPETQIPAKPKADKPGLSFYVDIETFNRDTSISDTNLDKCMIEQSSLRAYFGAQAARAEAQYDRVRLRFELLEAQLYDTHRKALLESGEKVTEKAVENAVKLDPKWAVGKNTVIEAETIVNINKAAVVSLSDRKDMLVQLGADRREEIKGAMRVTSHNSAFDLGKAHLSDSH